MPRPMKLTTDPVRAPRERRSRVRGRVRLVVCGERPAAERVQASRIPPPSRLEEIEEPLAAAA